MPDRFRPAKLDEHGRCCGRKPLVYKRRKMLFCARCDAEFNEETLEQQPNWAWQLVIESQGRFYEPRNAGAVAIGYAKLAGRLVEG